MAEPAPYFPFWWEDFWNSCRGSHENTSKQSIRFVVICQRLSNFHGQSPSNPQSQWRSKPSENLVNDLIESKPVATAMAFCRLN
jgi:hypothetical protein